MACSLRSLLGRSLFSITLAGTVTTAIAQPRFAQPPPGDIEAPDIVASTLPRPDLRAVDRFDTAPADPALRIAPVVVTRAKVRAALAEARARSIAAFHSYRLSNTYPSNTYTNGALNVWRDADGKFCAAASILRITGGMEMSERIASLDNNIVLGNVTADTDPALMNWILTSGLTQDELALIQRPFMGVGQRPHITPNDDAPMQIHIARKEKETKRLASLYAKIEAQVKKQSRASLETATDRLMANPELAKKLLAGPIRRV